MTPTPLSKPAAWMCEFVREDGSTDTQVVLDDPEGTRWADVADGDGVSPYRVTPLYAQPVRGEALPAEQPKSEIAYPVVAVGSDLPPALPDTDFVRDLLWNEHPECCGSPVADYGGEYMGQREEVMSCCGCPEPALLNDAQIVATLRARFPNV